MTPAELGTTIRQYREQAGLTQDGLGQLIAVDANLIDEWEWGEQAPGDEEADRLAEVLGIPAASVKPPEVVVEFAEPEPMLVEFITESPATPPPLTNGSKPDVAPVAEPKRSAKAVELFESARTAVMDDPRRSAWIGAAILAAIIAVFFIISSGGGEIAAPGTTVPVTDDRADTLESALETLRAQRDRLADRVEELDADVATAEGRVAAAEAEAERLSGLGDSNDELAAENQRLEAENEVLRKAVVVSSAAEGVQAVALTFDGSGSPEAIGAVLDTLKAKSATATFFPTGASVTANPALWQRAVGEGHELGNNTLSNTGVGDLDADTLRAELDGWRTAVSQAVGRNYLATWFRPPFMDGFTDRRGADAVRAVVAELGMATALWSVETYYALYAPNGPRLGGSNPGASDVSAYVVAESAPGSIVVLSTGSLDVAALPGIIDGLRGKGVEPTSLSGLFEAQEQMLEGEVVVDGDTTTDA